MITDLSVVTTASFFLRKKRVGIADINELLTKLRSMHKTTTRNLFRHSREKSGNSRWSAICFKYESTPAFLVSTTTVREELCGYLMLVEYDGYVAIFSSRLALPSGFKSDFLTNIPASQVEAAIAKQDAVFQKMRLRNMSLSQFAMRTKTLEAADLANVVGPAGSRRYAPQGYTVEIDGVSTTATPSTGRIAVRSDRVGHGELVEFAEKVIDELAANAATISPFIKTFARPMTIEEALKQSQPVALGIETSILVDAVAGDHPSMRLMQDVAGNVSPLSDDALAALIKSLDQSFEISAGGKIRDVKIANGGVKVASISLNKAKIALRSLDLPVAANITVEQSHFPPGGDPEPRSLREFLDEINAVIVLFDDIKLAYIGGAIFRDETLVDGGEDFLRYLHPEPALAGAKGEKKRVKFKATQTAFDAASTFGAIVQTIAANDAILVCDDLGDEWADFIGVRTDNGVTFVSFYHGKHGKLSLGASAFHVSVGQAIKNLGNMMFPSERIPGKVAGWSNNYNSDDGPTLIPRIARGNVATLEEDLARTRNASDTVRRAVIVTSSLSKKAVADTLGKAKKGKAPKPSFVQLYWLLQSFFSACAEVGASGSVVCRP
ncbi:hypothetical protein [Rhizobium rhizogenes]|uniref:hypothetical protein n=1 Tax=Rhizobium rhizogenes TaxID=359 RepID=UPI001885B9D4|nr:hypothetical protein [Rhizobium rhizogenes]